MPGLPAGRLKAPPRRAGPALHLNPRVARHLGAGLFVAQGDHGIDAHGSTRGDVTSRERDDTK
jgi:hypothetical protein